MERGFHGYRKLPSSSSSSGPEINMNLSDNSHGANNLISNSHMNADENNECTVREQDRFMPIANVIRIMRKILPPHAKISDDAKETIQECVSEYISFITGEANDRCQREQRKTITAEDVLWAMSKLGFDDYIEPLTIYLHRYREMEGDRGSLRGEPLVKRPVEYGNLGMPAFARGFTMAGHPHGYYGAPPPPPPPPMGGYYKDGAGGHEGSSHSALANGEAHGHFD